MLAPPFSLWARWAVAVFVALVLFNEPELHRRSLEVVAFAQRALHVAAVAPVQKARLAAEDFERRDWVVIFLGNVVQFRASVFQAGRRVIVDDFA